VRAVWLPFQLHPEVPREGMPREQLLPPSPQREQAREMLRGLAGELGLVMKTSDRLINSRLALATAEFARDQDEAAFQAMHKALFKAYWEQTARLDDIADLVRIGTENGLDPLALETALRQGRYEDLIDANRHEAESVGINGVPAHVVGRRFLVVGAQPEEVFRKVIDRLDPEAPPEAAGGA
jgi:predicted DsbA family dithiol-disulfide isomerase